MSPRPASLTDQNPRARHAWRPPSPLSRVTRSDCRGGRFVGCPRAERGVRLPKPEIAQVTHTLGAMKAAGTASPYAPPAARVVALPDSARTAFATALAETVNEAINPALGRLIAFLSGDYAAAARDRVGLSQYGGGEEYYRYLVSRSTPLDVTPEVAHRTGLERMATLEASMDSLLQAIGFAGSRRGFLTAVVCHRSGLLRIHIAGAMVCIWLPRR